MTYLVPDELYYSKNHEWADVDENVVTIGMTGFLLQQLGEVLYLDLPEEGKIVHQGETFFSLESVKVVHDFQAPVSGIILEVNQGLLDEPGTINDDPFSQGWLFKIEMDKDSDLALLMRAPEYRKYVEVQAEVDEASTSVKIER